MGFDFEQQAFEIFHFKDFKNDKNLPLGGAHKMPNSCSSKPLWLWWICNHRLFLMFASDWLWQMWPQWACMPLHWYLIKERITFFWLLQKWTNCKTYLSNCFMYLSKLQYLFVKSISLDFWRKKLVLMMMTKVEKWSWVGKVPTKGFVRQLFHISTTQICALFLCICVFVYLYISVYFCISVSDIPYLHHSNMCIICVLLCLFVYLWVNHSISPPLKYTLYILGAFKCALLQMCKSSVLK